MCRPIKDETDIASLVKDIVERDRLINTFQCLGCLDQNDAIHKIQELRVRDKEVAEATSVQLAVSSVPFRIATNEQIVGELIMQRNILQAKLFKLQMEGQR